MPAWATLPRPALPVVVSLAGSAACRCDNLRAFQQQKLALRTAVEVGCPYFEVLCRLAAAEVLYEGGERTNAMAQFQQAYDLGRPIKNHLLEYTGLMSYARIALEDNRRRRSGLLALRQALAVGKPRNFVTFTLWRPDPLARLMSRALEAQIEPDYAAEIIRRCGLTLDSSRSALSGWPWPYKVHTLGPFRLLRSNVPIVSSGKGQKRPLDLLRMLIAHGGREVSETHITEALWLDEHHEFTQTELIEFSGLSMQELQHLLDCEALLPVAAESGAGPGAVEARFNAHCLSLARSASRLRDDFELDANGLTLSIRLLTRIRELEAELLSLRAQWPHAPR